MTDNFVILFPPIFAFVMVSLTGAFIVYRINRYGRVFNWSPFSHDAKPPRRRTEP